VIQAAAERNVKVVFQSVLGVDADDSIPYRQVEIALENSGVPYVILRPNWFADNFHTYWKAGIDQGVIGVPAGEGKSSFIDVRDIASSAAAALTTNRFDNQAFNLTGPEALSYAQAAQKISEALGKPVAYQAMEEGAFCDLLKSVGVPADYAEFLTSIFYPVREGWTAGVSDAVATLTGKAPRSLDEYIADHLAELR
ncbi:MAG: NmrA family NAD(P)-binding protein, partial [Vibrio fluvialis]